MAKWALPYCEEFFTIEFCFLAIVKNSSQQRTAHIFAIPTTLIPQIIAITCHLRSERDCPYLCLNFDSSFCSGYCPEKRVFYFAMHI